MTRDPFRQPRPNRFIPQRMLRQLPPFDELQDVDFAVSLRAWLRRSIARGLTEQAERAAGLAAELVRRRAKGSGK